MFERNNIRTAYEYKKHVAILLAECKKHIDVLLVECESRLEAGADETDENWSLGRTLVTLRETLVILDCYLRRWVEKNLGARGNFCFEAHGTYLSVCLHLFLSASRMLKLSKDNMHMEVETIACIALRNYVALVLHLEVKCGLCTKEDIDNVGERGAEWLKFENE